MLSLDDVLQVKEIVYDMLRDQIPVGREGVVVPGSYDSTDSSVDVILADTMADPMPVTIKRIPLQTTHLDDGFGPIGGERAHLVPCQGSYIAHLYRGSDDAPGVPVGERHISHRNPTSGNVDSFIKHTNDGPTTGDGKGGLNILVGALGQIATALGFMLVLNDTAKTYGMESPGGLYFQLNDNSNKVLIGSTSLGVADEVVTKMDFQNGLNAIMTYINAHTHTAVQTGTGVSGPPSNPLNVTATGSSITESEE